MSKKEDRQSARLALEGNPIFTELRLARDVLIETNQRLLREAEEDRAAIRWLKARCVAYLKVVTILEECDHGDEATCRCRDRAAAITAEMLKDQYEQAATIARAHGQPGGGGEG